MSDTAALLDEIEAFLVTADMAPSTFGRKAVNNSKLVERLRAGYSVTLDTAQEIRSYIKAETARREPAEAHA